MIGERQLVANELLADMGSHKSAVTQSCFARHHLQFHSLGLILQVVQSLSPMLHLKIVTKRNVKA